MRTFPVIDNTICHLSCSLLCQNRDSIISSCLVRSILIQIKNFFRSHHILSHLLYSYFIAVIIDIYTFIFCLFDEIIGTCFQLVCYFVTKVRSCKSIWICIDIILICFYISFSLLVCLSFFFISRVTLSFS